MQAGTLATPAHVPSPSPSTPHVAAAAAAATPRLCVAVVANYSAAQIPLESIWTGVELSESTARLQQGCTAKGAQ